jgi:hypothetical protein
MCEKSFTANVASVADANHLGLEAMKPIVAVTALTIGLAYEMSKLDSMYQLWIIGIATLVSMNLWKTDFVTIIGEENCHTCCCHPMRRQVFPRSNLYFQVNYVKLRKFNY